MEKTPRIATPDFRHILYYVLKKIICIYLFDTVIQNCRSADAMQRMPLRLTDFAKCSYRPASCFSDLDPEDWDYIDIRVPTGGVASALLRSQVAQVDRGLVWRAEGWLSLSRLARCLFRAVTLTGDFGRCSETETAGVGTAQANWWQGAVGVTRHKANSNQTLIIALISIYGRFHM